MRFHPWLLASAALVIGLGVAEIAQSQAPLTGDLDQGWRAENRQAWYKLSQGSRLIPLSWLKALEQPGGESLFLDDAYIAGFRYIPSHGDLSDQGLPLGFVIDRSPNADLSATALEWKIGQADGEPWVGMNCAACHTAEISYAANPAQPPVTLRVEGGPTTADFQGFIEALDLALSQTLNQSDRFGRFAVRVLGPEDSVANRAKLQSALAALVARQARMAQMDAVPAGYRYGYARLDAFGNIFNKVALTASAAAHPNPATAPVSYPFLWNVPQHDKVQWNGIAPNKPPPLLPLARNTGEVIGVFADIAFSPHTGLNLLPPGYRSTINVENLNVLEQQLTYLKPPRWPREVFGAPDPAQVQRGAALYQARCAGCHALLPDGRDDLKTPITAGMFRLASTDPKEPPPGTDPMMACNAVTYTADSGIIKGTIYKPFGSLKSTANVSDMLIVAVVGGLLGKGHDVGDIVVQDALGSAKTNYAEVAPKKGPVAQFASDLFAPLLSLVGAPATDEQKRISYCQHTLDDHLAYKARPLYGVWATAPFLHNGSVPSLYDLLLPPDQRPKHFYVGTRTYDPVKVGYRQDALPDNGFRFDVVDALGQPITGNSNAGHDYGNASLSDADRWAIVAYLKVMPKS